MRHQHQDPLRVKHTNSRATSGADERAYEMYAEWCESMGLPAADKNTYLRETGKIAHSVIAEPLSRHA